MEFHLLIGELKVRLAPATMESLVDVLDETPDGTDLLRKLAEHQGLDLRVRIASCEHLDSETWLTLLRSDDYPVALAAAENPYLRTRLSADLLLDVLDKHPAIINRIHPNIEEVINCSRSSSAAVRVLEYRIVNSPDLQLRLDLARSSWAPESLLKKLVEDPDDLVSDSALRSLKAI